MIPDKAIARVKDGLVEAARILPEDIEKAILSAVPEGGKAESVMSAIKENLEISRKTGLPMCQDTGGIWCLASIGRDSDVRLVFRRIFLPQQQALRFPPRIRTCCPSSKLRKNLRLGENREYLPSTKNLLFLPHLAKTAYKISAPQH